MTSVLLFILILILGFSGVLGNPSDEYTDICGNRWKNGKRIE